MPKPHLPRHVGAAFRSSKHNEAYVFVKDKYVLINYAPGTMNDKILNGPQLIGEGFPMLANTQFGEYGIDCAFETDNNEAYIFCESLCARIDYAPHSKKLRILAGPTTIDVLFPFFKGTVFENGIDAAIRSNRKEVFLFKGDQYARIDYHSKRLLVNPRYISNGFSSLVGTVFESGIDAAFASHVKDEAYLFKGDYFARLNFAPDTAHGDYIVGGKVKRTLDYWSNTLRGILLS